MRFIVLIINYYFGRNANIRRTFCTSIAKKNLSEKGRFNPDESALKINTFEK